MDENKYQVIDPENDNYKLTAQDIINEDKRRKKRKKKNRAVKVLTAIVLILALLVGSGAVFVNSYLSKMNFGEEQGEINPEIEQEEQLEFEEQADADADIRANLSDDVLWYDDRIYNVLLIGVDYGATKDGKYDNYLTRSDSMILISINTINNVINMVSLSRAVYVAIPGYGNKRLNAAHAYGGADLLIETIEKNYKIRIDKYVKVDFSGFENIIDILGGVQINLTAQEASNVFGYGSKAGLYELDGAHAISYARLRSIDSDRKRTGRQRAVLNAIANKLRTSSASTLFDLLDSALPLVTTNFTKTELLSQVANAPKYLSMEIHEDIIPHTAHPLTMRNGQEVLILNWAETNKYTHDLLYPNMVPQSAQE